MRRDAQQRQRDGGLVEACPHLVIAVGRITRGEMQLQIERRIAAPGELHELAAEGGAERTLLQHAERFPEVAIAAGVDIDHRRLQVGDRNRAAAQR